MSPKRLPHQTSAKLALRNNHEQPQDEVQPEEIDQSCLLSNEYKDENKDKSLSDERQEFEKKVIATQSLPQETPTEIAPINDHEQLEAEVQPVEEVDLDQSYSMSEGDKDEDGDEDEDEEEYVKRYVTIDLANLKELRCPICLGILRKTKAVMECMHRFCGKCIEKSMRLSNNECPVCRVHCPSRRSLRDDPNFDNIIAAIYPDIDKYEEEEELAMYESERTHNKEESPTIDVDITIGESIQDVNREISSSADSHQSNTRVSGDNGMSSRLSRFINHLHNSNVNDGELDIPLVLVSLDEQKMPTLQEPYLHCRPTCSVKILCKYVALKVELLPNEVELSLVEESQTNVMRDELIVDPNKDKLRVLRDEETLADLYKPNVTNCGHLLLAYKMK
ncbi:hypothetical protein JHK87_036525 [Glycine soja]|nr:hypothetical protein JHK87_036525 [Glycine soja]